jgi:hypothetical protein
VSGKVFNPLLLLMARLTSPELARAVQSLKAPERDAEVEGAGQIKTTPTERRRLLRLGKPLGSAIRERLSIVSH